MNGRIKELAMTVQCDRHWNEEDIEKFAELIVKECANHLSEVGEYISAENIKTLFGVE